MSKLSALPDELLVIIFDFIAGPDVGEKDVDGGGADDKEAREALRLAYTCNRLYSIGIEVVWKTVRSHRRVPRLLKLYDSDKITAERLGERLNQVRVFRAVLKAQPNVLNAIRPHHVLPSICGRGVTFPNLRVLELSIQNTKGVTEHNYQNLVIPLLSPELKRMKVKTGNGAFHMHDMYRCIARRSPALKELSLSSTSAGLAAAHSLTIDTLCLQELHDVCDVAAIGSISGLKSLVITKQTISPLVRWATVNERSSQMSKNSFPDLVNLEITASNINALQGLVMTLPIVKPSVCTLLILRSDKDWAKIFELLEARIAPINLNKLELWFGSETSRSDNDYTGWRDTGLAPGHLQRLSPFRNLRHFHFSASNIDGFQINARDQDIESLAMSFPRLVALILEGCPTQTTSKITLMALEYLATYLEPSCAPLDLQLPLSAVQFPGNHTACLRNLKNRTVDLDLPNDLLPILPNVEAVFRYLTDVMPRIRSLEFKKRYKVVSQEGKKRRERWTSLTSHVNSRVDGMHWPVEYVEDNN